MNTRELPRITACMQWQGILSTSEVKSAIRDHRQGIGDSGGCEAVAHYGGATKLLKDAIRNRATVRRIYEARRHG